MMDQRILEIIAECERQEESCNYTSTALYEWLKEVRVYRILFITLPIICGSVASAKILLREPSHEWVVAMFAMLAGLFPAVFKALDLDVSLKTMSDNAYRFKVLQDRFRQAARIGATGSAASLEEDFKQLMDRMDDARSSSLAIPNRHLDKARKIIEAGVYKFEVDESKKC